MKATIKEKIDPQKALEESFTCLTKEVKQMRLEMEKFNHAFPFINFLLKKTELIQMAKREQINTKESATKIHDENQNFIDQHLMNKGYGKEKISSR